VKLDERLPFRAAAFLASFLTFSLELTAAKMLLPRFGGSAYVWTTCVMIFQGLLFAGYAWCRAAPALLGERSFTRLHAVLLIAPLFCFPLRLPAAPPALGPVAGLAWALLLAVGAPFLVLSTTVPVVQARLMRAAPGETRDAYALYAASNLGATAALLSYPFLVEPLLSLDAQSRLWMVLYAACAGLSAWCLRQGGGAAPAGAETVETFAPRRRAMWLLLSAAPCAAMLATSNFLTLDFAAVPLLWTAPLAVYLLTLVLNFKREPWYPGRLNSALLPALGLWVAVCLGLAVLTILRAGDSTPIQTLRRLMDIGKFGYVTAALFVVGMICHKSLAADRPASEAGMGEYYLWIAGGGWLGSLLIGVAVPWLGRGVAVLSLDWIAAGAVAVAALAARDWDALSTRARGRPGLASALAAAAVLAAAGALGAAGVPDGGAQVFALRNFYGVYRVVDKDGVRLFYHGNTDHGAQSLAPALRAMPLSYYNSRSPLAEAYGALGEGWRSIAVIGLGAGGIAAYGRAGRTMDFYELDPDVSDIALKYFTYLKESPAAIRVVIGDARLSLERNEKASYDLLILDAFNSGAVPIHLVTEEALALYLRRLTPGGVVLLHVSNRYLDLRPMLADAARELGLSGAAKRLTQNGRVVEERVPSSWVALSRDPAKIAALVNGPGWTDLRDPAFARGRAWTDRHASLLPVLAF
jgi:SAM-dependent methyltransferase